MKKNMKVTAIKKIEDCLESTNARDILLDGEITQDFIEYLGRLGKLTYIPVFEKPFFKVIVHGKYTLKGSEGNISIRVLLPDKASIKFIEDLKEYVGKYGDDV